MGARIAYVCEAKRHVASSDHPDKLTIHEGQWAFCQFSARADHHEWHASSDDDLIALMRKAGLRVVVAGSEIDTKARVATKS